MQMRRLGRSGLEVSAIGLGCWGMSGAYGFAEDGESVATIHRAIELGITLIDTADAYGKGHNEELVGGALRGLREKVILATKFGRTYGPDGTRGLCGRPDYVKTACDASLRRLGVDVIDLYYLHRIDPAVPVEETVGAMAELVRAGKVRHLGLSEANAQQIRRAVAVHPIAALQSEFSLFTRDLEDNGVLATIRELGIALVPFAAIGRGILSATVRVPQFGGEDVRKHAPRFQGENFEKNLATAERFGALAAEFGVTPAQLALAWVAAQGDDVIPLTGTKRVAHLEENVAAARITLTQEQLARIAAIVPKGSAAGARSVDPFTVVA